MNLYVCNGLDQIEFLGLMLVWVREIMHAMWKPAKYKYVYLACCFYVLSITIPHSVAVYWAFGDELLHQNNAFGVLPSSNARSTGIIFMIIHQVKIHSQNTQYTYFVETPIPNEIFWFKPHFSFQC